MALIIFFLGGWVIGSRKFFPKGASLAPIGFKLRMVQSNRNCQETLGIKKPGLIPKMSLCNRTTILKKVALSTHSWLSLCDITYHYSCLCSVFIGELQRVVLSVCQAVFLSSLFLSIPLMKLIVVDSSVCLDKNKN